MGDAVDDARCAGCGSPLPHGAMFCAECGRAVAPAVLATARETERCDRCGAEILPGDIFCGECGHVAGSITRAYAGPRDTVVIEPLAPAPDLPAPPSSTAPVRSGPGPTDASPGRAHAAVAPGGDVRSNLSERMRRPHEPAASETSAVRAPAVSGKSGTANPSRRASQAEQDADHADVEATRIVPSRGRGDRYVLQFSTGESVTVYGSGLIGRNPVPEPGEYFDQVVRVFDPTRSVSKTHLEFGQDGGSFWVRDRYSGNGTIVREPDSRPRRCDPGKRYPVMRGGRIDLGEQFVVVS